MLGQEPFGYFGLGRHSGFSKVTRRKGGTNTRRYPNNGDVHPPKQTYPDKNTRTLYLRNILA